MSPAQASPRSAGNCAICSGMPDYFVSEVFLNLWLRDTPLEYTPAYGPAVRLGLAYHDRNWTSLVSWYDWQGAQIANEGATWACGLVRGSPTLN
jgi:hypothetical protein